MAEKVLLDLQLETAQARKALDGIEKSFDSIKTVAKAAVAVFAGKQVLDFFSDGIESANKQEKAMAQLAQQLKLTGEYSTGAMGQFEDFADQMEKTTKYGDDLILSQTAVAKSFGLSNEKATELVKAATELSAATGMELNSAVQTLGKTYSGVTGKLDEQIPVLKTLTKAQLENGDAVDIVLKRFGGSAAAEINTFSGAMLQTQNAADNLKEAFGTLIVQNPVIIALVKNVGEAFNTLTEYVDKNKEAMRKGINEEIISFIDKLSVSVEAIEIFAKAFKKIDVFGNFKVDLDNANQSLYTQRTVVQDIARGFVLMALGIAKARQAFADLNMGGANLNPFGEGSVDEAKKQADELVKTLEGIRTELELAPGPNDPFAAVREQILGAKEDTDSWSSSLKKLAKQLKAAGDTTPIAGSDTPSPKGGAGSIPQPFLEDSQSAFTIEPLINAIGTGLTKAGTAFFDGLSQGGKDGAKTFIAGFGGAAADLMIPGIGGAVSQAIQFLGQDPETFRASIDAFIDGIPEIIDNIIENIPVLMEKLAENSGEITTALVASSPKITIALAKSMPLVAQALAEEVRGGLAYQSDKAKEAGDVFAAYVHGAGGKLSDYFKSDFPNDTKIAADAWKLKFSEGIDQGIAKFGAGAENSAGAIRKAGMDFKAFALNVGPSIRDGAWAARDNLVSGSIEVTAKINEAGTALAQTWSEMWTGIGDAAANLAEFFNTKVPETFASIGTDFKEALLGEDGLLPGLTGGLSDFATEFKNTIGGAATDFYNGVIEAVNQFIEGVTPGGGGGGSADIWEKGKGWGEDRIPGLALGGTIPPGFPNDSFFGRMSSGELNIPRDDVVRLRNVMDQIESGGGDSGVTAALLAKILEAVQAPVSVSTKAEVNGKALADIILQLNRQNARLSA